jgi:hypothetical protein
MAKKANNKVNYKAKRSGIGVAIAVTKGIDGLWTLTTCTVQYHWRTLAMVVAQTKIQLP